MAEERPAMKILFASAAMIPLLFVAPSYALAEGSVAAAGETAAKPTANAQATREEVFSTGVANPVRGFGRILAPREIVNNVLANRRANLLINTHAFNFG